MSTVVNMHEAKTHLSRLIRRVLSGEEIIIARGGKPVAVLVPYGRQPTRREPGDDAGAVVIHLDFDDPLPEFES